MRPSENVADWERLDGESAKAYAAFCVYRDLGPGRSLAIAYGCWRRANGVAGSAVKAAGFWQQWSSAFGWVARAAAYDAHLDAEKRALRARLMLQLEQRRFEYELANQERLEQRVAKIEALLDKADKHPLTDVVQERDEPGADGRIVAIKTKIKGLGALSGYARLAKEANDTAAQAINGVRTEAGDGDGAEAESGSLNQTGNVFVWVPPADPEREEAPCDER